MSLSLVKELQGFDRLKFATFIVKYVAYYADYQMICDAFGAGKPVSHLYFRKQRMSVPDAEKHNKHKHITSAYMPTLEKFIVSSSDQLVKSRRVS